MARNYNQMIKLIETILIDAGINPSGVANQVFSTAELDEFLCKGLTEVSKYRPYQVKATLTTTPNSRELTLTDEIKRNLLWIDNLEYKVDQYPKSFRNFTRFGDVINMELDYTPTTAESVYLYLAKRHILTKSLNDTVGAVNAQTPSGSTSITIKSLGSDAYVPEDTTLEIEGDDTDYTVIENATITTNVATCKITPALALQAEADTIVTLTVHDSTLDIILEDLLADLVAARAAIAKARSYIGSINISAANTPQLLEFWGQNKLADTLAALRRLVKPRCATLYARD